MGQVKKMRMEIEEAGNWPSGLQKKYVCMHHFDDPYLNNLIERYGGEKGICSSCGRHDTVCSMQTLMEQVTWKIHMYFQDVNEASLYYADSFYDDENEIIPGFKRAGEYVVPKEAEYYSSKEEMLEELVLYTDDDELNNDVESVFTTEEWIESDILHQDERRALYTKWMAFANAVTYSRRYTFLATPEFLPLVKGEKNENKDDILTSLRNLIIAQKLCRTLSKGTTIYRARRVDDAEKMYSFGDITAAPAVNAAANRMSPAGVSLFYASFNEKTATRECVGEESKSILVGEFAVKKDLNVLDLTIIPAPSFWMPDWQENEFLHTFNREITKRLDVNDKNLLQYIPTQVFTEYLRYMFVDGEGNKIDGVLYGSSMTHEKNLVLFCSHWDSREFVELQNCKIFQ